MIPQIPIDRDNTLLADRTKNLTLEESNKNMNRIEIDAQWADATIIEAGEYVFVGYCMGNEGQPIEEQMQGAFDVLEERLRKVGLTLESVVKMDCLFKDIMDLDALPNVIKNRFNGNYPARKAFETKFIREGIAFQLDAIAYKGKHRFRRTAPECPPPSGRSGRSPRR